VDARRKGNDGTNDYLNTWFGAVTST